MSDPARPDRSHRSRSHAVGPVRAHLESQLMPEDFERALRQMKRDLALTQLRRSLLDPELDAASILAMTEEILALQEDV